MVEPMGIIKMSGKINVLLDSNIRNLFYKDIVYHNSIIHEIQRFSKLKNVKPFNYLSPFSFYEEAGFRKFENFQDIINEDQKKILKRLDLGGAKEADYLFEVAEDFIKEALVIIRSKYSHEIILGKLNEKIPFINHETLKKRYLSDMIEGFNDERYEVLLGCLGMEMIQDKFIRHSKMNDKRSLFLLSLFYHFLADYRNNSLFRSAFQIWHEDYQSQLLKDHPEFEPLVKKINEAAKINSREDFVDNEVVHFSVMGNRRPKEKIKFLTITNDPIENVLSRISLYKFTVKNCIEIGKEMTKSKIIPGLNEGYIGSFENNKLKWLNVSKIPSIGELRHENELSDLAKSYTLQN